MTTMISDENKRMLLQSAVLTGYQLDTESVKPEKIEVVEVYADRLIYNIDGQDYEAPFTFEDDKPVLGEAHKVVATKTYRTMEALSVENTRSLLDAALHTKLQLGQDSFAYIEDFTETDVMYNHDRQSFKAPYTITEDGAITLGDSVKVTRVITYKSLESLKTVYTDLIFEAGKRNAALDSTRVKQILSLCQELLSSEEEPAVAKIKTASKEATNVLAWVKAQEATKTEDGVAFPMSAYAYTPEADTPSGWKLRLWETLESKVTRAQLGRAAAALSPGGFRGNRVRIPSDALSGVKRKIRSAYRRLGVDDEDIPRWVKEVETRELIQNFVPLTEAKIDKGRATVVVIKAGFNESKDRYYPAEMLIRDFGVFEGAKMYADHPTAEEDEARPERSIKDWVATLTDVKVDEAGTITGVAEVIEPWLMTKLASLRERNMLGEMGISINAVGSASKATIEGTETLVIEKLVASRSVDFVTEPGAGGIVTMYETRAHDIDLVELSGLRERRPDLVKAIETALRAEIKQEVRTIMESETQVHDLEGQVATLTTERDDARGKLEEADKAQAKAVAQKAIKEAVDKAELPDAAKDRLIKSFAEAETADGIEEAITSEKEYLGALAESGKVRNLGPSVPTPDKDMEAFKESMKAAHPDWDEDTLAAAVTGR